MKKTIRDLSRNFNKTLLLIAGFILIAVNPVFSQNSYEVTGVVSDAIGPLPAVNVMVKGTTTGVTTDENGKFALMVMGDNVILEFTSLGFSSQEIPVGTRRYFEVTMKEDVSVLDQVVVTGYGGTQKRSKLTNSITTIKKETLEVGVYSNPAQALSGAVAGLKVSQTSGNPGSVPSITLRGGTNWDGTGTPLVLIDGQVRDGLNDINPDDIESMEVLKDAGATAIYGARANNGVILVTTKKGKTGDAKITLKAKVGLNYLNIPYDFMNAGDYLYWVRTSYKNAAQMYKNDKGEWAGSTNMSTLSGVQPYGTGNVYWDPSNPSVALDGNKDSRAVWSTMKLNDDNRFLLQEGWQTMTDPIYGDELIYRDFDYKDFAFNDPAITQDYTVSMSGGNDKGHYYASFGYYNAEGTPIQTYYRRLTATFNADYKLKSWLTSYTTLNWARALWENVSNTSESSYFGRMLSAPPTMRGYNADGDLLLGPNLGDGNPLKNINAFFRDNNSDKYTLAQSFKVDILKGLSLNASATYLYQDSYAETFNRDYLDKPGIWNRVRTSTASDDKIFRQTYVGTLNYALELNNHSISALAGIEYFDYYKKGFNASGSGAPTDDFRDLNLTTTGENKRGMDSWHSRERILSFIGRVDYDYMAKYLLSFTFRQDGYSKLIDNRWGFFPGVSAGWVFSKENFMKNLTGIVNFAKLRGSYGLNGDVSGVGMYELRGLYGTRKYNGATGYYLSDVPNPSLRWEKSHTFEIGLDLGFFQNKFNLNFTYYNRTTMDKFANIPLPGSSGITGIRSNNGTLRNKGVEIEANARLLRNTKDWKLDINANIAYNKNVVVKLPFNGLERNMQNAFQVYDPKTKELIWVGGYQEGQTPGDMYAFIADGIYRSEAEVQQYAAKLQDISTGNNGSNSKKLYGPEAWANSKKDGYPIQPGDVRWRDINGDGIIDNYDQGYVGNSIPKWTGGFNTTLSWKGLSLYARFDYALGHSQMDNTRPWFMGAMQGTYNSLNDTKNTWTESNPNAEYPKYYWADQLGKRNYARSSSMFVYKASYLCFREVSLSYRLPESLLSKIGLSDVVLSVTGQNLGYISNSKLYSPEAGGAMASGYPLPRIVIFGTSITF